MRNKPFIRIIINAFSHSQPFFRKQINSNRIRIQKRVRKRYAYKGCQRRFLIPTLFSLEQFWWEGQVPIITCQYSEIKDPFNRRDASYHWTPVQTYILSIWIPVLIRAVTQLLFAMVQRWNEIVHPIEPLFWQYLPVMNFHWLLWFQ